MVTPGALTRLLVALSNYRIVHTRVACLKIL